ncbi:Leucine aminopeptidase 1, partial [Linderina pennispora]
RLIQTSETEKRWLNEKQIFELIAQHKGFIDITDTQDLQRASNFVALDFPTTLTHQTQVNAAIPKISDAVPKSVLTNFTQFTNRYYNSNNGKTSSTWLLNTIKSTVPGIDVQPFAHRFPQSSIIARIPGTTKASEIVVISAHQDSINQGNPSTGRAPGADDDGSGTVTILEALRVLVASGLKPARTIEFHWYAGEEGGLLGSSDIVSAYRSKQVVADIQFDMTGYPANPPAVGIVTDYTDPTANDLVRKIVTTYTDLPAVNFQCGYGCSDHASWNRGGVRSSIPFENQYLDGNSNIHTTRDTLATVNFPHLLKFVRIALAYAIEVGDAK